LAFISASDLGDIALITRQKLDLEREEVKLKTDKTGRLQILPLAAPLLKYVKKLRLPAMIPMRRYFPRAFGIVERQGRTGNLSNQFHKILVAAGLAEKRSHHNPYSHRYIAQSRPQAAGHSQMNDGADARLDGKAHGDGLLTSLPYQTYVDGTTVIADTNSMSQPVTSMPLPAERALRKLGRDLALARRKRGIATSDMAARLFVSRDTLVAA
jgi:hypothetical protein